MDGTGEDERTSSCRLEGTGGRRKDIAHAFQLFVFSPLQQLHPTVVLSVERMESVPVLQGLVITFPPHFFDVVGVQNPSDITSPSNTKAHIVVPAIVRHTGKHTEAILAGKGLHG